MYRKILVPLDGSEVSELVLPHAQHIAQSFNATLELISTVATPEGIPADITSTLISERERYLQRVAESLQQDFRTTFTVTTGHPAEVIIKQAEARDGTLVVIATHGHTGAKRWFLGGVALKIVQHTKVPVLMIPAKAMNPEGGPVELQNLIAPLDGSPVAEQVLPHVVSLCKLLNMELILVRAYNPHFPGSSIRMHDISVYLYIVAIP